VAETEGSQSPTSSAEVKNEGTCSSTPPYTFMAWYILKLKDALPLPFLKSVFILS
jgi:hypothetical protein